MTNRGRALQIVVALTGDTKEDVDWIESCLNDRDDDRATIAANVTKPMPRPDNAKLRAACERISQKKWHLTVSGGRCVLCYGLVAVDGHDEDCPVALAQAALAETPADKSWRNMERTEVGKVTDVLFSETPDGAEGDGATAKQPDNQTGEQP